MDGQLKVRPSSRPNSRPVSPSKTPIFAVRSNLDPQPFKPKAKVNSVAQAKNPPSVVSTRVPAAKILNVSSPVTSSAPPRARSRSPARSTVSTASRPSKSRPVVATTPTVPKAYAFADKAKAADSHPKARSALGITRSSSLRPSHSVPNSPDGALSTSPRDSAPVSRQRNGSLLRHSSSQYYTHPSTSADASSPINGSPPLVIKARVSDVTLNGTSYTPNYQAQSQPPSPSLQPMRHARNSSMSSTFSTPNFHVQDQTFYPITTPSPAANPHRYSTVRSSPPPPARQQIQAQYRPFTSLTSYDNESPSKHRRMGSIDKTSPSLSPPNSSLSYSSRSSISRGPSSHRDDEDETSRLKPLPPLNTSLSRSSSQLSTDDYLSGSDAEDMGRASEDERSGAERAEAKSNRKMADLEIINRSLTATNSSLEATKHRQAREIRELRRKLRESRLVLPPRTYKSLEATDDADDQGDEDDSETESDIMRRDESYARVRILMDSLLENGKRALESKPADFSAGGGTRVTVLSAEEVKNWRGNGAHEDDEDGISRNVSPARVAIPDSSSDDEHDDDELSEHGTPQYPPPIRITTPSVE